MYFKDRFEQRQTREIIAGLFGSIKNYCDEKTKNALLLTLRILEDVDTIDNEEQFSGDKSDVF